jgi:hypothetical protein
LRNVQQEFLVVRFHFRKKLAQFGEVSGFLACASPVPRQNHDQLSNQHLASRPVTLLKSEIQLLSEFWRRTSVYLGA